MVRADSALRPLLRRHWCNAAGDDRIGRYARTVRRRPAYDRAARHSRCAASAAAPSAAQRACELADPLHDHRPVGPRYNSNKVPPYPCGTQVCLPGMNVSVAGPRCLMALRDRSLVAPGGRNYGASNMAGRGTPAARLWRQSQQPAAGQRRPIRGTPENAARLDHGAHHPLCRRGGGRESLRGLRRLADQGGHHGLVPMGTTGESPTVTHEEHRRVIEICVEVADRARAGDCGRGLELDCRGGAHDAVCRKDRGRRGALGRALLQQADQEGLFQHFSAVAGVHRPADHPLLRSRPHGRRHRRRYHGAPARGPSPTSSASRMRRPAWNGRACSVAGWATEFILLSGEDMTRPGLQCPWRARLHLGDVQRRPETLRAVPERMPAGRLCRCAELQDKLAPLHKALFLENKPGRREIRRAPLGLCRNEVRLPVVPVDQGQRSTRSTRRLCTRAAELTGPEVGSASLVACPPSCPRPRKTQHWW